MQRKFNNRFILMALAFLVLTMTTPFFTTPQVALAKDGGDVPRYSGLVQTKPASGFVGTWKIGAKSFVATASTQIDQGEGKLTVGACAKVKYQVVNGKNRAIEIDSEPATDCR